jgi:hypothetical protein
VSPSTPSDWEKLAEDNKLTPSDVAKITKRLGKLDDESKRGPWTRRTLELISEQPGVVSTILARQMGIDRYEYKAMIYKLKRMSLTYSLDVGYSISPRGRAYLRLTTD